MRHSEQKLLTEVVMGVEDTVRAAAGRVLSAVRGVIMESPDLRRRDLPCARAGFGTAAAGICQKFTPDSGPFGRPFRRLQELDEAASNSFRGARSLVLFENS